MICRKYGKGFWKRFKAVSDKRFNELMGEFEDIGKSMFALNYAYAPCYVAEFTAMESLGLSRRECDILMLNMNERMITTIPKPLLHTVGKVYYRNMSKKAAMRVRALNKPITLHKFDWNIDYRRTGKDKFEIDIKTCGFITYTQKYGGENMLPGICRIDYMLSHYMNIGFSRTGTLAFGDSCCDCKYEMNGGCEWGAERALDELK
jgi:hypothetical protein